MIAVEFGIWQVNTGWLLERIIAAQECFKIYIHVTLGTLTGVYENVECSLLQVKTVVGLFILRKKKNRSRRNKMSLYLSHEWGFVFPCSLLETWRPHKNGSNADMIWIRKVTMASCGRLEFNIFFISHCMWLKNSHTRPLNWTFASAAVNKL